MNATVHQLGRGPLQAKVDVAQLGPVCLHRISLNQAVHGHGARSGVYGFGIVTPANPGLRLQRRFTRPGQVNVIVPPGEWDHIAPNGLRQHITLTVDADELRRSAEILHEVDLKAHLAGGGLVDSPRDAFDALHSHAAQAFASLESGIVTLEDLRAARFEQECIEKLLDAILPAASAGEGPRREVSCRTVVRRAEEFMVAHLRDRVTLTDLCREAQVSERTLRAAFGAMFGVSPMDYFKTLKLGAVREALREADPESASVYDIASRWGFHHTGNFARDYHRLFGSLPSEALGR
jgi:AraC-like DNA-binding protein